MNQDFNEGVLMPGHKNIFMCVEGNMFVFPRQRHLALTGTTDMVLSWMTDGDSDYTIGIDYSPIVAYSPNPNGPFAYSSEGDTSRTRTHYHHNVIVRGLMPDTLYYYRVGDVLKGLSALQEFAAPPNSTRAFSFAIVGDMGVTNSADTIAVLQRSLSEKSLEWVYHVGDISYADDRDEIGSNPLYDIVYDQFLDDIEGISSTKPYMVLPGNHDAGCHGYGNLGCLDVHVNYTYFRDRFRMPHQQSGSNTNMWYSFDYSLVHFVSLSTETDYPGSPDGPDTFSPFGHRAGPFGNQLQWLQDDLAKAVENRKNVPWIVVLGHRAMYTCKNDDWPIGAVQRLTAALEPLLQKFQVDAFVSGHVHDYERSYPVSNGQICSTSYNEPACTVHVVNGAAGNIEGHQSPAGTQPFTAFRNTTAYGFSVVDVARNSLTFSFYDTTNQQEKVIDSFSITKQH